ncbi:hypothetical protein J1605_012930 [Eschrichtius robustus]|uniref:Piezo-type mechanosensitive ion channel component 1 n=1 Tax=Eschrichtius robustus TaxID=9764 RepID=A0AB34GI10_ESCRO|nr:hypothetical protein J1605_012930 [Eschrichtius robustus]
MRRILKYFRMVVVSYSMVVLIAVYTFQFQVVAGIFKETLKNGCTVRVGAGRVAAVTVSLMAPISFVSWLHDVGLERFDAAELFAEILLPAALLLACILQRHYFNEDLLKTTSLYNSPIKWKGTSDRLKVILRKLQKRLRPGREEEAAQNFANKSSSSDWKAEKSGRLGRKASAEEETSDWDSAVDKLTAGFPKLLEMVNGTQGFSWRILEIDIVKLVAPVVIWLTLQEKSCRRNRHNTVVREKPSSRPSFCAPCAWPVDSACKRQGPAAVLVLMTLEVTVSRHQRFHRLRDGLPEPLISTTSDTVTREHLDNGPRSALQFFVNFGFCKFGLEVHLFVGIVCITRPALPLSFVAALHAVGQRVDFYALVQVIWLIYPLNLHGEQQSLSNPVSLSQSDASIPIAQMEPGWAVVSRKDPQHHEADPIKVKVAVSRYHFWFVLCLVFIVGTTRIHILGAGYLVAFGYFMLQGSRLLLQPVKITLRPRDCLVAYSALVVAVKTFLAVGACVYLEALLLSHCWLAHSFALDCTVPGYQLAVPEDEACEPPEKEAGVLWDAMCLTFLLIQRWIFLSYYHLYVVADLEAAKALASRYQETQEKGIRCQGLD